MRIIGGRLKNRKLFAPEGKSTRPTLEKVREALFNICQNQVKGALFLDLFAGSGAMAFEALSRGAKKAILIDNSRLAQKAIQKNAIDLNLQDQIQFFFDDVLTLIEKLANQFDIIYVDPPYATGLGLQALQVIEENSLLKKNGRLFIEDAEKIDYPVTLELLTLVKKRKLGKSILYQYEF